MLKCIFLFSAFQLLLYNAYGQDAKKFTLDGTLSGRNRGTLYLIYSTQKKRFIDSAEIRDGKFIFHGLIDEPTTAELTDDLKSSKTGYGNYLSDFYLEPGVVKLSTTDGRFAEAKVSGSKTNNDYRRLTGYINPVFERIFALRNQAVTDSGKGSLSADSLAVYTAQLKKYLLDFIVGNPDSYIGILATQRLSWLEASPDAVLAAFNRLTPRIKNTGAAIKLREGLVSAIVSATGHPAPDFSRKDINGNRVTLSAFKGHYVLLDFWASWCVPCRAQTPHLKSLHEKYSAQGLKVVAISCDSKYDAWQKAVFKDNTESFVNVLSFSDSDMEFLKLHDNVGEASFEGELRKQFNLMPIPVYILIDPEGVILGRYGATENDSAEMLDKKLIEIFHKR